MQTKFSELNVRKKAGLVLLAIVLLYWIAFPVLPFLDIPNKLVVLSAIVVIGEVLMLAALALLGKEYWADIKKWTRQSLARLKKSSTDRT
ncbi:transporter suffix domain-containing protein [Pseudoduganella sp. HUAS MS19]